MKKKIIKTDFVKKHEHKKIKNNGEIFTPEFLINEMLDKIPSDIILNCSKKILDNCCGNGNFLWVILQRRLANGSTHKEALSTLYGVEIDEANYNECKKRLAMNSEDPEILHIINNNIKKGDGLVDQFNEFYEL